MSDIDYKTASYDELDQHVIEQIIFGTDELSPILRGHIFIEKILETLISKNVPCPEALFTKNRLTFELKIDIARALGLLENKTVSVFKSLNNIRNNYAHRSLYKVTFAELNGLKCDWVAIQNKAYKAACTKGVEEAAKIAVIFLCWQAAHLISDTNE